MRSGKREDDDKDEMSGKMLLSDTLLIKLDRLL